MKAYRITYGMILAVFCTALFGATQRPAKHHKTRSRSQSKSTRTEFDVSKSVEYAEKHLSSEAPKKRMAAIKRVRALLGALRKRDANGAIQRKELMRIVKNAAEVAWVRRMAAYMARPKKNVPYDID